MDVQKHIIIRITQLLVRKGGDAHHHQKDTDVRIHLTIYVYICVCVSSACQPGRLQKGDGGGQGWCNQVGRADARGEEAI